MCTGRIVDVNNMWVSVLGWGRQEMVNRESDDWSPLVYRDCCERDDAFEEWMATSLEEPLPPVYDEVITKDGRVLAVRAALAVLRAQLFRYGCFIFCLSCTWWV